MTGGRASAVFGEALCLPALRKASGGGATRRQVQSSPREPSLRAWFHFCRDFDVLALSSMLVLVVDPTLSGPSLGQLPFVIFPADSLSDDRVGHV